MFATLTLLNRVRAITNSSTSHTSDDEVVEFVRQGVRFVLSALPLNLASPFASDSSTVTGTSPIIVDTTKVLSVQRGDIKCLEVPIKLSYDIGDSNSLHYASNRYPACYLDGNNVYIKPNPSATAVGKAKIIDIPATAVALSSTDTESIDQYDGIAIKYAAAMDFMGISGYWGEKLLQDLNSTEISGKARDALANAADLIDNKTDYDAEDFLAEEDSEMVTSAVQTAAQEVNRALAETRGAEGSNSFIGQSIAKASQMFTEADRELQIVINQGRVADDATRNL